jgi:hypothetical protein
MCSSHCIPDPDTIQLLHGVRIKPEGTIAHGLQPTGVLQLTKEVRPERLRSIGVISRLGVTCILQHTHSMIMHSGC